MSGKIKSLIKTLIIISVCLYPFFTAMAEDKLIVATKEFKPFVMKDNNTYKGFSIDLWNKINEITGYDFKYIETSTTPELLKTVKTGKADFGVAGISLTSERERILDFSHVFFNSGLQIMVNNKDESSVFDLLSGILSPNFIKGIGFFILLVLVSAHIVWFCERKDNSEEFPRSYLKGIWEGIWWSTVTCTTVGYGDKTPKGKMGRIFGLIWIITGLFIFASFTATITSSLTIKQMQGSINGPSDLPGKKVGTLTGTTASQYLRNLGVKLSEYGKIEDAYKALESNSIDAIVYDSPALLYHSISDGIGKFKVVGPVFKKEGYSIAFPPGSKYRKNVNEALLKLKENGEYDKIYSKWFGNIR